VIFRSVGESHYQLVIEQFSVTMDVERLRRDRQELVGELTVCCTLAGAHTVTPDGLIHLADFNLSSAVARNTRAKMLRERSEADLDWGTMLEQLCLQVIRAERIGTPSQPLDTYERRTDHADWQVHGWRLPRHHPSILFGDGGSLKSYLALYVAGTIAHQGAAVLYCDWELAGEDHHERLRSLFGAALPRVHYLRCDRPLVEESDRVRREAGRLGVEYLICDSVGFATPGPPESAEMAVGYFRAIRQIGIGGSLHLAHSTKATTDDPHRKPTFRGLKPFGSAFWHNSARSTWYVQRSADEAKHVIGLFHQKANTGPMLPAVGLSVRFGPDATVLTREELADYHDLSVGLPLRQRITAALKDGPKTVASIAEEIGAKLDTVEKTLKRSTRAFTSVIKSSDGIHRWALLDDRHGGPH